MGSRAPEPDAGALPAPWLVPPAFAGPWPVRGGPALTGEPALARPAAGPAVPEPAEPGVAEPGPVEPRLAGPGLAAPEPTPLALEDSRSAARGLDPVAPARGCMAAGCMAAGCTAGWGPACPEPPIGRAVRGYSGAVGAGYSDPGAVTPWAVTGCGCCACWPAWLPALWTVSRSRPG